MRKFHGLMAVMESADNISLDLEPGEAAEIAVTVADDSAVVQSDSDDVEVTVAEVEDAVQGGEELAEVAEVASAAVESGEGLTEESAELASIAIESIRNRLGFGAVSRLVPATESFGNVNTRMLSTKMVVESITESIKNIWAAIKAAALRLWDKIATFFTGLFNTAGLLAKHIKGLQARAQAIPAAAKPTEANLKSGLAKSFSVSGKADKAAVDKIIAHSSKLFDVSKEFGNLQKELAAQAVVLAAEKTITEETVKKFLAGKTSAVQKGQAKLAAFGSGDASLAAGGADKEGEKSVYYGPFIGSQALVATVKTKDVNGKSSTNLVLGFEPIKGTAASEIEALDLAGVKARLGEAASLAAQVLEFKNVQGSYSAMTKDLARTSDTILSSAAKILDSSKEESAKETRAALKELQQTVNNNITTTGAFANRGPALLFKTAKELADYASISMRNLK